MTTVFESISDSFYTAFFVPDSDKRKQKIEAWIKESTPVIQAAVEDELRAYIEYLLDSTWEEKGWVSRARKFCGEYRPPVVKKDTQIIPFIDAYQLQLSLKILRNDAKDIYKKVGEITPDIREKTNEAIKDAKTAIAKLEPPPPKEEKYQGEQSRVEDDDDDDYEDGDRSPNDDRSDSMNPNNDAYQASMDNRSDQMNPNNEAYWSSRGR